MAKSKQGDARGKVLDLFDTGVPPPNISDLDFREDLSVVRLALMHIAYRHGNIFAHYNALQLCKAESIPVPAWVVGASMSLFEAIIGDGVADGRGQSGNPIARARNEAKKFWRWQRVTEIRSFQTPGGGKFGDLPKDQQERLPNYFINPGNSLDDAFEKASESLVGSFAYGAPATIKNSFKEVERSLERDGIDSRFNYFSSSMMLLMRWRVPRSRRTEDRESGNCRS